MSVQADVQRVLEEFSQQRKPIGCVTPSMWPHPPTHVYFCCLCMVSLH